MSLINDVGAVTGAEEEDEEFHEQTWFIVVVVIVGLIMVTIIVLMLVCVARSVRRDKSHEGKYNGNLNCVTVANISKALHISTINYIT